LFLKPGNHRRNVHNSQAKEKEKTSMALEKE